MSREPRAQTFLKSKERRPDARAQYRPNDYERNYLFVRMEHASEVRDPYEGRCNKCHGQDPDECPRHNSRKLKVVELRALRVAFASDRGAGKERVTLRRDDDVRSRTFSKRPGPSYRRSCAACTLKLSSTFVNGHRHTYRSERRRGSTSIVFIVLRCESTLE